MTSGIRIHIIIGGIETLRCCRCVIVSERHKPLTVMSVRLADPAGDVYRTVKAGDAVTIRLGYRNETPATWKGSVSRIGCDGRSSDETVVDIVGGDLPLTTTAVRQSWEDEAAEAIVRYAVRQSGLQAGRIDAPGAIIPRYAAATIPVWQVARQCAATCERAFGIDMSRWALWMGSDGTVNWGDFDEAGEIPVIATGGTLIAHLPGRQDTGWNGVETFLLAGFRHSRRFRLVDTKRDVDGTFRAQRVVHDVGDDTIRTFIWYGAEHGES